MAPQRGSKHGPTDQQATFEIESKVRQDRREETGGVEQPKGRLAAAEAGGHPADRSGYTRLVSRWRPALSDPHQRRAACIHGRPAGQAVTGNTGRAQRPVFGLQCNPCARGECVVDRLV
jgi:hypothetical protein